MKRRIAFLIDVIKWLWKNKDCPKNRAYRRRMAKELGLIKSLRPEDVRKEEA